MSTTTTEPPPTLPPTTTTIKPILFAQLRKHAPGIGRNGAPLILPVI